MKLRLRSIEPIQLGKVLAVLYALIGVIALPFVVLAAILGDGHKQAWRSVSASSSWSFVLGLVVCNH